MKKSKQTKVAIIGGGASGLVAGIIALRKGADVTIYEKNAKLAKKILATGNGRCNVSNQDLSIKHFHGQDKDFIRQVLGKFPLQKCKEFFREIGVELFKKENGRYYPLSNQASSIANALSDEFQSLGGQIMLESAVTKIEKTKDGFEVFSQGKKALYEKVLLSSGSKAMVKDELKSYDFAKNFGHKISPTFASLVQLVCKEDTKSVSGVKFEGALELRADGALMQKVFGDILLTNYGLSGSAVLDASRCANEALLKKQQVSIKIDCLSSMETQTIKKALNGFMKTQANRDIPALLNGLINKKLALYILSRCLIPSHKKASEINKKELNAIAYTIKNLTFNLSESKGFDFAEVSAGGVETKDINPQDMRSKLVSNLYFSGEILDVDGDCGGYNLHWAWASGYVAGSAIAL